MVQVYFATQTKTAVTELNASIRRSLRSVFRTIDSPPPSEFLTSQTDFLEAWRDVSELPPSPFFSEEEEDYVVEQYGIQGFEYSMSLSPCSHRGINSNLTLNSPRILYQSKSSYIV